jgi:hypothetical protein
VEQKGDSPMKCPHCLVEFHPQFSAAPLCWDNGRGSQVRDPTAHWAYRFATCPACHKVTIYLRLAHRDNAGIFLDDTMVYPKGVARSPLPQEVKDPYASDYREACNTLTDSPKASAALSRRCLQNLLREEAKVKHSDLATEIQQVLDSKSLPSYLSEAIDGVRNIGNFAAHPIKSTNTGEIIEVEPGEAEWLLDTLEGLFDFYFVQPEILKRKRAALNAKLAEAKKPPMK